MPIHQRHSKHLTLTSSVWLVFQPQTVKLFSFRHRCAPAIRCRNHKLRTIAHFPKVLRSSYDHIHYHFVCAVRHCKRIVFAISFPPSAIASDAEVLKPSCILHNFRLIKSSFLAHSSFPISSRKAQLVTLHNVVAEAVGAELI